MAKLLRSTDRDLALVEKDVFAASPFLKWAGGKSQLLSTFGRYFPKTFKRYFEPFLGGGAVFFHLVGKNPGMDAVLSDSNNELINCYQMIQTNLDELVAELKRHRNDKHYFYKVRALDISSMNECERAARMIFLNKTCFNGLYRVNRKGQFNVPFGKYTNPRIVDERNLMSVREALSRAKIVCAPFETVVTRAGKGDFVYLDPPYQPLSSTSSFTGYTRHSFGEDDQKRLMRTFETLTRRGCQVMLSNSDTDFVRELYADYRVEVVRATRAINSRADRRGRINELLILNY